MNRQQKESLVKFLESNFSSSEGAFLVNYQGVTVSQMQKLRFALSDKGGSMKVAKNRLAKIALADVEGCKDLKSMLQGQLAFVFAEKDVSAIAKVVVDFAKANEELQVIAGCCESQLFDANAVKSLASLPSREVLLAQLCGTLKGPQTAFVMVLRQLLVKFLLVLKAVAEQKS